MQSYYTYSTPATIDTGFFGTPVYRSGLVAGSAINNTSDKWTHADLMLSLWVEGGAGGAGGGILVGIVYSLDGAAWESADSMLVIDRIDIPSDYHSANPYMYMLKDVKVLPYYFRIVVRNISVGTPYVTINGRARKMVFEAFE